MISNEKLQTWEKHEKEIEDFLSMRLLGDEMLFNAIKSCSELLKDYADNVRHFSVGGDLIAIEDNITEMRKTADNLTNMLREAKGRAYDNS